ncbi:hypothetical protein [Haliangium sp.]|uniref:hypothetical protein n=1 Tax=Haliangium sp. TaxID=2663208 RepID=UPI003D0CF93D
MTTNRSDSSSAAPLASNELVFNGIDGTTGGYLTAHMDVSRLAGVARGESIPPIELGELQKKSRLSKQGNYLPIEGVDPNDLAQAGWALVFPFAPPSSDEARRQAEILEALTPLRHRRRAQATRIKEPRYQEYTGERGYQHGESKQQYLARLGMGTGSANPDKVPYYLLIVASPEQIPYRIQYQIDVQYAVGRIHFDTVDEYSRYARSVVEAETGQVKRARRAAFFGVANHDDRATQLSNAYLVDPLAGFADETATKSGWAVERYLAEDATRARLDALYRDPPALLFTASHGVGFPCGHALQRERQGALLCQDWGGPGSSLTPEHYFAGEHIDSRADLRGLIGVHFACYGMGTPAQDNFVKRALGAAEARAIAPNDFVARLPQRMLANPGGGALATIGHIDRAWGSSFLWMDAQGKVQTQVHLEVFESTLTALFSGKRVGYALEHFNSRYAELAADLSARLENIQIGGADYDDHELAQMWIFQNDARNYAVVGDPAVRIPGPDEPVDSIDAGAAEVRLTGSEPTGHGSDTDADPLADETEPTSYGLFSKKKEEPGVLARFGTRVTELVSEAIADAATLEVKTYVSRDMRRVNSHGNDLAGEAGAYLRAYTRCALDGDTEVCVPVNADGEVDESLWTLHVEMVKQAQQHRTALLQNVLSLVASILKG